MIPEIGHYALVLALFLALVQSVLPLVGAAHGDAAWMDVAKPAAVGAISRRRRQMDPRPCGVPPTRAGSAGETVPGDRPLEVELVDRLVHALVGPHVCRVPVTVVRDERALGQLVVQAGGWAAPAGISSTSRASADWPWGDRARRT